MRVFLGIVGLLMLLVGAAAGLAGAVVIGDASTDSSWSCTTYADPGTNTSKQDCYHSGDDDPAQSAQERDLGLSLVIGASAVFIGGCAFIGGAAAGTRVTQRHPAAAQPYPSQPVSAGPPTYGS